MAQALIIQAAACARNIALHEAGYPKWARVPACESNRGIPARAVRFSLLSGTDIRFSPSDRSMVFTIQSVPFSPQPIRLPWLVLLDDQPLVDKRGRKRRFGSAETAMRAAITAERGGE